MIRTDEPNQKIFLVGHSFGGELVLYYGIRFPESIEGLVVSSPNVLRKTKVPFVKQIAAPLLSYLAPVLALGNEIDPQLLSHDPEVVEAYKNDTRTLKKITTRLGNIILSHNGKLLGLAKQLRVPCLLMHAGDDQICSPEATQEFYEKVPIRDKTLKIYEGFYHELFNEVEREKVFLDMQQWIEKRIPPS